MRARTTCMLLVLAGLAAMSACGGSSSGTKEDMAGAGGSAGGDATGGADGGRGDTSGNAGRSGSGGTSGSAGRTESGGASAIAGRTESGGTSGSGGRTESGGTSGVSGATVADGGAGNSGIGGAAGGGAESVPGGGAAGLAVDSCLIQLSRRSSGSAPCGGDAELRCLQIEQEPDRVVYWYLSIDTSVAGSDLEAQVDCLAAYAAELGVQAVEQGRTSTWMGLTGTYAQLSPLLEFDLVEDYEVSCVEDDCEYCRSLSLDACEQDAFCSTVLGNRLDDALGCVWHEAPAGCYMYGAGCGATMTYALSPAGDCWEFPSDCLPEGYVDHTWDPPTQGVDCLQAFSIGAGGNIAACQ